MNKVIFDETINRAIAEILGKCLHHPKDWVSEGPEGDRDVVCGICRQSPYNGFPDYVNDLNAMHAVEHTLGNDECKWHRYAGILIRTIEPHRHTIHATARQRCLAFLDTIDHPCTRP